jgi:hypothetical protein
MLERLGVGATADVVIGADGIHSVLQGFVVAPAKPVFSGVVAYRGLVPRLDEYPAGELRMWVGQSKHFLVFPVRAGQLLNYVGFVPSGTSVRESCSAPGGPEALAAYEGLRRDRTASVQLGSRRQGAGWDSSGSQLIDRRWIYEYDAWAEAIALT